MTLDQFGLVAYDCIIECDASWDDGSAGFGYVIIKPGGSRSRGRALSRKAIGPQHAEILCVVAALRDAAGRGLAGRRILVRCDSKWVVTLLSGTWKPRRRYIVEAVLDVREATSHFAVVDYKWVRSKMIRRSDKAALRGRKKAQAREIERVAARTIRVEAAYKKAQECQVSTHDDRTYLVTNPNQSVAFTVDLNALTCNCIHFEQRWANKDAAARAKNMTPCLHMAAAAKFADREMPWDRYRPRQVSRQIAYASKPEEPEPEDIYELYQRLGLI